MDVNGTGVSEIVKAPDLIEQLVAGKHAVVVRSEEVEQFQFLRRNVHRFALEFQFILLQADFDILKLDHLVVALSGVRLIPSENRFDTRGKFFHIKRLGHEIIRAQLQSQNLIKDLALCRDHNHGLGGNLADLAADLPTVLFGEHNVKKNQIRLIHLEVIQPLRTVGGKFDVISLVFKIHFQQVADIGIIVNDQNLCICHFTEPPKS